MGQVQEHSTHTRMIFMGDSQLADGFQLIGFETFPDPSFDEVDRFVRDLILRRQNAFLVIDRRIAEAELPSIMRVRKEGGHIVVTPVPPLNQPDSFHLQIDNRLQAIFAATGVPFTGLIMNRVEDLETAIIRRADKLAAEYRERAERRKASILKEAGENLRLLEERETTAAKAQADLVYLRRVQAVELRMRADMYYFRWGMVQVIEHRLKDRMVAFTTQEEEYLKTLQQYLAQGAADIESDDLIAEVNHHDHQRLVGQWDTFAAAAAPNKRITLAEDPIDTVGGVLISSADRRIRLNNTFEGRRDRLRSQLHQIIVERIIPATAGSNQSSVDGGGVL